MSRCTVCNVIMSEQELKHKDPISGRYTDMCTDCLMIHECLVNDVDVDEVMFVGGIDPTDDSGIEDYS